VPFTLSHPAAAIPFARSRLVLSALVAGSMAPDFQYFIRLTGQERDAHSYPGVILLTFPAAVLGLFLFHAILKWPLISLLPRPLQERLVEPARQFRWRPAGRTLLVLASLAVGILTHIAWDSFTHVDGLIVGAWPSLRVPLFYVGRSGIPPFKVAQHLSSLAGGLFILFCFAKWYTAARRLPVAVPRLLPAGLTAAAVGIGMVLTVAVGIISGLRASGGAEDLPALQRFASGLAVTSISTATLLLLAYSTVWWCLVGRALRESNIKERLTSVSSQ
jgi:Domain of unknown function (DUF4184)